ncbi:hypothetical protein D3C71_1529720 [compost metagenome]
MLQPELLHQARQKISGEALGHGQAHRARAQALQRQNAFKRMFRIHAAAPGVHRQDFPRRREHHAARLAFKQGRAQGLLQPADLAADGRGGDMQTHRGFGQGADLRHFQKVAQGGILQLVCVHGGACGVVCRNGNGKLKIR